VVVEADETTGYRVTVDQLEAARTPRTKMLVFVSPSNPTGAVYPADEVRAIGEWAADHGIWIMTDEIYEHLVYGDATFSSMPVEAPSAAPRCVVVNGVAKTYAMTGWRVARRRSQPEPSGCRATRRRTSPTSASGLPWPPSKARWISSSR